MIGTNANDILARALGSAAPTRSAACSRRRHPRWTSRSRRTSSASSSRRYGRDGASVRRLMASLAQSRCLLDRAPSRSQRIRERVFGARRSTKRDVADEMAEYVPRDRLPPRSAHAPSAPAPARALLRRRPANAPRCARDRPSGKVPGCGRARDGRAPGPAAASGDLMERAERFTVLPNEQATVERFIRERARAVRGAAA